MGKKFLDPHEINEKLYRYDKVHHSLASINEVQEKQVVDYKERGFLSIEGVLSPEEVNQAAEAIMRIVFDPDTEAKVQFVKPQAELKTEEERELAVRKVHDYVEHDETLRAMAYHPGILAVAERLLGEPVKLVQDMALLKPPHGGGEKPWHQDMAYGPLAFDKPVIGVWIALDEAAVDNGCMHVIPRSHMDGATPHYAVRDWQVCDANVPVERDVVVPLQPGGILFFHGLLVHGTPSNFSTKRRRALQFHYVAQSAEKLTPREYKRVFTNEMTGAEC